jgi:hypothetical protein
MEHNQAFVYILCGENQAFPHIPFRSCKIPLFTCFLLSQFSPCLASYLQFYMNFAKIHFNFQKQTNYEICAHTITFIQVNKAFTHYWKMSFSLVFNIVVIQNGYIWIYDTSSIISWWTSLLQHTAKSPSDCCLANSRTHIYVHNKHF